MELSYESPLEGIKKNTKKGVSMMSNVALCVTCTLEGMVEFIGKSLKLCWIENTIEKTIFVVLYFSSLKWSRVILNCFLVCVCFFLYSSPSS